MNDDQQTEMGPDRFQQEPQPVDRDDDTLRTGDQETSVLARRRDPSLAGNTTAGSPQRRTAGSGVVWVRPSDLLVSRAGRLAGRGIDFQAELARRTRQVPGQAYRATRNAVGDRVRRLPPVSAFGRRSASSGVARSGIGLG